MSERRVQTESELVELVRGIDEPAPQRLHARVQALVDEHGAGDAATRRRRLRALPARPLPALGGAAVAAAAIVVAIVLATGGGGAGAPDLQRASALTLAAATGGPPAEKAGDHARLNASVDGIAFPYWAENFRWRSVGTRSDRIGGREVRTVYYVDPGGRRIGYAIVGGTPPVSVGGGTVWHHDGTDYRLLRLHGAEAVVWTRNGRLCVVSGHGVDGHTLLRLASWDDRGSTAA